MGIEHITTLYSKDEMEEMIRTFRAKYGKVSDEIKISDLILDEDWRGVGETKIRF